MISSIARKDTTTRTRTRSAAGLQAAVALGIDDLRTIASPREAVIACYSRLQLFADRLGVRRETDTPHELMERLVAGLKIPGRSVAVLTRLFERAKFSTHAIDEPMRTEALEALTDVRDELETP